LGFDFLEFFIVFILVKQKEIFRAGWQSLFGISYHYPAISLNTSKMMLRAVIKIEQSIVHSLDQYGTERAKQIKIADKISNVRAVTETPPADWPLERRREYIDWTEKVMVGLRGCNQSLEYYYDQVLKYGRRVLDDGRE
jgi:hypothetical protein